MKLFYYLKKRLTERSFWLQLGAAIVPAAVLPHPWALVSVIIAVFAALVPDGPVTPGEPAP